jgi:hypothetical protein
MKTYFNLRSTINNGSWSQRGLAALAVLAVAAVVGITLMQVLRSGMPAIPAAPAAQVANPARPNPNVPISGTGSAYDGGSYGSPWPSAPNLNVPAQKLDSSDSGSAYAEYIEYLSRAYGSPWPTAQAQPTGLGIDLPPGTDLRGWPAGLTDYLRHTP